MDINSLLKESKAKFNHTLAKSYLKEKYQNKLIFADQNGLWKATPELLAQLSSSNAATIILVDSYDNPIKVDREALFQKASVLYTEVMEAYHVEWTELKKQR